MKLINIIKKLAIIVNNFLINLNLESYIKKPTSAVSKASTNTHYMSQMKGLED